MRKLLLLTALLPLGGCHLFDPAAPYRHANCDHPRRVKLIQDCVAAHYRANPADLSATGEFEACEDAATVQACRLNSQQIARTPQ